MNAYISYYSALFKWNVQNADLIAGFGEEKLEAIQLTTSLNKIRRMKGYEMHYTDVNKLPPGSISSIDQQSIASPELLFLQMARVLPFERLLLLGLQLCSHPVGQADLALTSTNQLQLFLNQISNVKGIANARRAVPYIKDGAASVVESILYMRLALPNLYGGYGFKDLHFNYELWLSRDDEAKLAKKRLLIDLCIPSKRIAIEYMSNSYHNDSNYRHDSLRKEVLERMGFHVFWIHTRDLYDPTRFEQVVKLIASCAKHRIRIRNADFDIANKKLHNLLPRSNDLSTLSNQAKQSAELKYIDDKIWDRAYASQFISNPNLLLKIGNPSHCDYQSGR